MSPFSDHADDYYVNMNLNTELRLPNGRETVLHYFEQMRKAYPQLTNFYTRENGDLVLEGDKSVGSYRWIAIESRRLSSGYVNPESLEEAYGQMELVLDIAPHLLTLSVLDCEALDVMYGFDLNYAGNHDEVVAEAFGVGAGFESVAALPGSRMMNFEPSLTLALDESCRLQCRLSVETRSNAVQVRTGEYTDEQISIYLTVRHYWDGGSMRGFVESFRHQATIGEEIVRERVIPHLVRPLAQAIASR